MPLGMALAPARRAALVAWASAREGWILEDDYDGEYRFDRDPVGALQALAPDRVIYLGSASKTLAPALRLGWMAVAPDLLRGGRRRQGAGRLRLARSSTSSRWRGSSSSGDLDRHLRRMRARYRRPARRAAGGARRATLPDVAVEGLPAGLHLSGRLAPEVALGPLLGRAWAADVGLFGFEHGGVARLLLGYANLPEPSVVPAVRALAEVVRGGERPRWGSPRR